MIRSAVVLEASTRSVLFRLQCAGGHAVTGRHDDHNPIALSVDALCGPRQRREATAVSARRFGACATAEGSQANAAKLLESNLMLMRIRELEVLEKIATESKLNVLIGENGEESNTFLRRSWT